MKRGLVCLLLIFTVIGALFSRDEGSKFIYEKDLDQHLYYYDLLDNSMLPYVDFSNKKNILYAPIIGLWSEERILYCETKTNLSLFLDGHLLGQYPPNTKVLIAYDSLELKDGGEHVFSFYSEEGVDFLDGLWVVAKSKDRYFKNLLYPNVGLYRLKNKKVTHLYILAVFVLVVLAYMRFIQSPYILAYFDVTKFSSRLGVEDFIYINPFTGHSVLIMFLMSTFYAIGLANMDVRFGFFNSYNIVNILLLSLLIAVIVLFKYIFLLVLSRLFGDTKIYKCHFFEFKRFFCLFGLLFLFYSVNNTVTVSNLLLVVYLIWLLWLLFELVRKSSYRKMYLISYICISEIFPIFLLIKQIGEL